MRRKGSSGEQVTLAIVFTDVVGSTGKTDSLIIRPPATFSPDGGEGPDVAMKGFPGKFTLWAVK